MPTSDSMWAPHNADKRDTWFGVKRAEPTTTTVPSPSKPRNIATNTKPLRNQEDAPKTPTSIQPQTTSGAYQSMWAPHNAEKRAEWLGQPRSSDREETSPASVRKGSLSVFVASEARLLQTALYEALDTSPQGGDIAFHEKPIGSDMLSHGPAQDEQEHAPNSAKGIAVRGASAAERVVEDSEESGEPRMPRKAKKIKRHPASASAPWERWEHDHFESM